MEYPNLLVIFATLLLLQFEMGVARSTYNGLDPSLYVEARRLGLDEGILNEMWRTKKPWTVTKTRNDGTVIRNTYQLSTDGEKIFWNSVTRTPVNNAAIFTQAEENLDFISNNIRNQLQTTLRLANVFNNPFINPVGFGFPDFNIFHNFIGQGRNQFNAEIPSSSPCHCHHNDSPNNRSPGYIPPAEEPTLKGRNPGNVARRDESNINERNSGSFAPRVESNLNERNSGNGAPREERNPTNTDDTDLWYPPLPTSTQRALVPVPASAPAPPAFGDGSRSSNDDKPLWLPVPDPPSTERTLVGLPTLAPKGGADTVIDDFLAKVDVTAADIKEEDGTLVRTIVDKEGRVLSASFELKTKEELEANAN
ncbi:uncharacterized protein LOC108138638 isoform X1 [Drosophila elegans]|uniref:uncharacterized protein LOC108138638 isoform X1 n=1 Tax=Drosophila elegans TaxID=30023 RepID=UPI0007E82DDD|nr:uncharacterized protein LOC108138638 isoform X1 [Drosophila elegans]